MMMRATMRIVLFGLCSSLSISTVYGQAKMSDKDLESLMRNLRDDAKAFRSPFSSALKKSAIRKTSQAKDAENLAELFEKQSEALLNDFKETKKANTEINALEISAQRLGKVIRTNQLGSDVTTRWNKIETEMQQVLSAFGISPSGAKYDDPREVTPVASSSAGSCTQAVGAERAQRLVRECLQVSSATHPPCNAENSCALIIDEIKRGCGLLGSRDTPGFCNEYKQLLGAHSRAVSSFRPVVKTLTARMQLQKRVASTLQPGSRQSHC
jgi:hypothetical protein